jgi:uncharacterized DUF497 family protein
MTPDGPKFSWDPGKDKLNKINHGISFEEAKSVFYDEMAKIIDDPDHSLDEDRFIILGISNNFRILMVCHCYRTDDDIIRIISARKATKNEIKTYKGL